MIKYLSIFCLLIAVLSSSANAQTVSCPVHTDIAGLPDNVIVQEFSSPGGFSTAWRVSFDFASKKGLFLTNAYFKPGPDANWIKFVDFAGLSDLFVPYAQGSPRYWDLSQYSFDLVPLSQDDVGACGKIIGDGFVAREVRDAGVLWMNDENSFRSNELVLWANLDAANYNYLISYKFKADGTIEFRTAGTAANLPGREFATHIHNGLWRIDIDLDGEAGDTAFLTRYIEPAGSSTSENQRELVGAGNEAGVNWIAKEYTTIQVQDDNLENSLGRKVTLDFRPIFRGVGRHIEEVTSREFWVTRSKSSEVWYADLLSYVDGEPIESTDITVWLKSPILHVPRDEDGNCQGSSSQLGCSSGIWVGSALAMWGGFDLRPRNLFVGTPFYP